MQESDSWGNLLSPAEVAKLAAVPAYHRTVGGDLALDRWIGYAVKVLRDAGVETFESCQGGRGHAFPEPTVRFHGGRGEGLRAAAAAMTFGLPVFALRRCWSVEDGELRGPHWELTFYPFERLREVQEDAEKAGLIQ